MAYQYGQANTAEDLLDALRLFLISDGWTVNAYEPASTYQWLSVSKNGYYFNLIANNANEYILSRGATGFDSGQAYNAQPGMRTDDWTYCNYLWAPFTSHHFFSGDTYFHVVIEESAKYFRHFGCGVLDKVGSYDGGDYCYGTYPYVNTSYWDEVIRFHNYPFSIVGTTNNSMNLRGTAVRCPEIALDASGWIFNTLVSLDLKQGNLNPGYMAYYTENITAQLFLRAPNTFNGEVPLVPLYFHAGVSDTSIAMLGTVKDIRQVKLDNYFGGPDVLTIGSDEWYIFPVLCRTYASSTTFYSSTYGLALRKNV
jgi:hypothetical protein